MKVPANQSLRLQRLLQQLFNAQAREAASQVTVDRGVPDMSAWVRATADAVKPLLLQMHQQGMVRSGARIAAKLGVKVRPQEIPVLQSASVLGGPGTITGGSGEGVRRYEPGNDAIFGITGKVLVDRSSIPDEGRMLGGVKAAQSPVPSLVLKGHRHLVCKARQLPGVPAGASTQTERQLFDFDLFSPRVLDAVDQAAMRFCRETMDTATVDAREAVEQVRRLMREGLPRGDAIQVLAKRTREVFADPARAFRIATTEASRAMHAGQQFAAKESGVVWGMQWLASSDACENCLELDGKQVKLGEPFILLPGGGPYSVIWHPPLHPHCFCDETEVLL